jgi:N-formylglutamate deformylase
MRLPFLISVPHSGTVVPPEAAPYCILDEPSIRQDGDVGAREIFAMEESVIAFVRTDVARAIVDVNRAEDDFSADGVIKDFTIYGKKVYRRQPPQSTIKDLILKYYQPYHRELSRLAADKDVRLGLDCHTMAETAPPLSGDNSAKRPCLCVSDLKGRSCPATMTRLMLECLEDAFGVPVSLNHPFQGGYITRRHSAEMPWLQIEINRAVFLPLSLKKQKFNQALQAFARKSGWLPATSG